MKKIVVVGSLNMDLVIHTDWLPRIGETVIGRDFARIPGGKGANQAVAAARLGGNVSMIGCVGDDIFGSVLLENLHKNKVDIQNIKVVDNSSTGLAMIIVNNGDNCIILSSGANFEMKAEDIESLERFISGFDILITQLEIPMEIVRMTLRMAKKNGLFVILNPAPAQNLDDETLRCVDVIVPNETEAEHLTGNPIADDQSLRDGIRFFHEKGIPHCVITLGSKGVVYGGPDGIVRLPAMTVQTVDTTAAGDSFVGALAVQISQNVEISEAIRFCNMAAALTVTRHGAQESLPTRAEMEEFRVEETRFLNHTCMDNHRATKNLYQEKEKKSCEREPSVSC